MHFEHVIVCINEVMCRSVETILNKTFLPNVLVVEYCTLKSLQCAIQILMNFDDVISIQIMGINLVTNSTARSMSVAFMILFKLIKFCLVHFVYSIL